MILLDTNVVSELMRPEPAPQVASWVRSRDRRELFTSSITLAEIRYGLARLPDGRRKQVLLDAADDVFRAFSDQVLPVDVTAAEHYAIIASSPRAIRTANLRVRRAHRSHLPFLVAPCWPPATCLTSMAPASTSSIPGLLPKADQARRCRAPIARSGEHFARVGDDRQCGLWFASARR